MKKFLQKFHHFVTSYFLSFTFLDFILNDETGRLSTKNIRHWIKEKTINIILFPSYQLLFFFIMSSLISFWWIICSQLSRNQFKQHRIYIAYEHYQANKLAATHRYLPKYYLLCISRKKIETNPFPSFLSLSSYDDLSSHDFASHHVPHNSCPFIL